MKQVETGAKTNFEEPHLKFSQ